MPPTALHPRSATEIIDAAFRLLRRHYAQIVAISVVAMLPLIILRIFTPVGPTLTDAPAYLVMLVVSFVCTSVAEAATVIAVSDSYLSGKVDIASALAATLSRILSVLAVVLIRLVLMLFGFIFLFFPGVYVALRTFAAMPALLLERLSPDDAIRRTWRLAGGSVGKVFVTMFLAFFLYFVLFSMLLWGGTVLALLVGMRNTQLLGVLQSVVMAFLYPIVAVVVTLLYYDLRIRREGFDLEIMAKELG